MSRMYEIAMEVGNWYGTFFDDSDGLNINDNCVTHTYATVEELLQDWVYTMLEDEQNIWDTELEYILTHGIKVEGIRAVKGQRRIKFHATINFPINNKESRTLSAGSYKKVKEAFVARQVAVGLRKECLNFNKTYDEFKKDIYEMREILKDKETMIDLCYTSCTSGFNTHEEVL